MYCCVLINGKIAAATEDWWSLHPIELKLLANLATIENTMTSKDIPVFLPYKSPNVSITLVQMFCFIVFIFIIECFRSWGCL